jgi:glycosyltransferase involved in cell wall biosynthesis
VGAGAAELVDQDDPEALARAVARVVDDPDVRERMRRSGTERAASFTWERAAQAVLASYAKALQSPVYSLDRVFPKRTSCRSRRLRIALWTPVNPCQSGVSDYSEALVAELGKRADVEVFVDGYQPSNQPWFDSIPTFDARAYPYLAQRASYDIDIYQVGNNPLHLYMIGSVLSRPGIVTLHDACIYYLVCAMVPPDERPGEFWHEVAYCEGPDVAALARTEYARGKLDPYGLMLNRRLVEASRGVVVHSAWVRRQVEQYAGAPPVRVIPHGMPVIDKGNGSFQRLMRRVLGLPSEGFVFGVFGNLHRVKRIDVILRAFFRLRETVPEAILFLKGKVFDPVVAELLQPWLGSPRLAHSQGIYLRASYDSTELLLMSMQAVDAGINLRYPTAGETSGTLSILLSQSKPVIVSDIGSFSEYPDDCCPKTPLDDREEEVLYEHMLALASDRSRYRRVSQAAGRYGRERSWSRCAERYLAFVEDVLARADRDD